MCRLQDLTGNRAATVLTPAAVLLTPWAVHEHGALTPELVALPLMMGAALLSADRRHGLWAGVLCGLLVLIKLPLAIPAVVLVLVGADTRRAAVAAVVTLLLGLGITWAAAGDGFWRDVVVAQMHSGSRSLGPLTGFWAQAGWNVLGLVALAAGRSLPAGQPDQFLPSHSPTLAAVNAQIAAARNVCPPMAVISR